MANKRLSDTAAIQSSPPIGINKSVNVKIRKIDNGFIISKSVCDGNNYSHSEVFSEKEPAIENLTLPGGVEEQPGKDMLKRTAEYLNRTDSNIKRK